MVRTMVAGGMTQESIARSVIGPRGDPKTLRKHYADELDTAATNANAAVVGKLYAAAMAGESWAICFWLKCRARWQEVVRYEHTGADAGPMQLNITDDGKSARQTITDRIDSIVARLGTDTLPQQLDGGPGGSSGVGLAAERAASSTPTGD